MKLLALTLTSLIIFFGVMTTIHSVDALQEKDAEIQCRKELVLVFRINSNNYACVSDTTAQIWAKYGIAEKIIPNDAKPQSCTKDYRPMCGVDGKTYGNMCMLESSGVDLAYIGECGTGNNLASFDIVILNGRVMDPETNFDGIRNVGIKDGRIVSITEEKITGKETIDASGLVVSPGFIDTHFHGIDPFATKLGVLDGITTGMDLEAGALDIDKFYNERENNRKMNYGTTVSHVLARMQILDDVTIQDVTEVNSKSYEPGQDDSQSYESAQSEKFGWSVTIPDEEEHKQIF
ncbi:MAG: hypothetical protein HC944_06365 [Nanoarchaeota archaeon]|nr:hypothetical protein [Nanoarchaeota archaeon]